MRGVLVFLLVAGCGFSSKVMPGGDDSQATDAAVIDVPVMMLDACTSFSTQVNTCIVPAGFDMPLDLTGMNTYSTLDHTLTRGTGQPMPIPRATVMTVTGMVDVIYVSSFSLAAGGTLHVSGPLPVAILSSGVVQIDGTIDLVGPAAGSRTDSACAASVGKAGDDSNQGGGGGGGGAFQGDGGTGGDGNSDGTQHDGGAKGTKIAARPLGILGGCDGGEGGKVSGNSSSGGDGGGAILIASGGSITVSSTGAINVAGSGGSAGNGNGRGAGGGGSGGMMLLESKQVAIQGVLAANGGSGGEGNTNGNPGEDGKPSLSPAIGASGGDSNGGDGGDGAAGLLLDAQPGGPKRSGGGGGGGGGVGFIAINCPIPNVVGATISPPFMPWP